MQGVSVQVMKVPDYFTIVFALIEAIGVSGIPTLTSDVEVIDEKHITVPGAEVVFTCQLTDSFGFIWSAPPYLLEEGNLRYSQNDVIGESRTDGPFVANIISKMVDESGHVNITTTLTFVTQEQFSMLEIICSNAMSDGSKSRTTAVLYFSTTRVLELTTLNTESSIVCPDQSVTLVCKAINASYVEWIVDTLDMPFRFTAMSTTGTTITDQGFVGKLISPSDNTDTANITTTLNFLASSETFVQCSSDKGDVFSAISTSTELSKPQGLSCSSDMPDCVSMSVTLQCSWDLPIDNINVSYSIMLSNAEPMRVPLGHTMADIVASCQEPSLSVTLMAMTDCNQTSSQLIDLTDQVRSCQSDCSHAGGLSAGAAAGITIAIVLAVVVCTVLIIVLVYLISRRRRNKFSVHTVAMSKLPQATPFIRKLEVSDITETSAQVKWKIKGVKSDSDCCVTLTVQYMDGSIALQRYPSWKENGYKVEDLMPGVEYQVYLTASNENGESVTEGPEELITKCGDISVFTTPYLASITWKSLHQYREQPPDEIIYLVKCNEAVHEEGRMSNTETVKTVKVNPTTSYTVSFTVKHRGGVVTSGLYLFTTLVSLPKRAEKLITLTEAMPYYVWQEQGITVKLQKHTLPDGSDVCPVKIEVSLPNCPEVFPDNNDPVSPIVNVSTPVKLKKPLEVTVVQCGGTKATVAVVTVMIPGMTPKRFTVNESMMVKKSSKSTTTVSGIFPECCFAVVSESSTTFCAHVYYDDQKGDLYMTLAKNIPVYTKVLNDYAKKKGFRKVQEISELSFHDGQDVMTVYDTNKLPLAEFDRYMCSYFTYPEEAPTAVMHLDQDQPLVHFKVNFSETEDCWIHFSTRQEKRYQELDVKNIVSLRAIVDSNLLRGKLHMWQEIAIALGVGDRITSISHTYQEDGSDRLCALEMIAQWIKHNPHPTSETLMAALGSYFTDWTDLQTLKVCVKEDTEDVQNSQTEVKMDDIDEVMKHKHLNTNWELLAVALGLGGYISFISKKEKSAEPRARALIQLWITLEERSSTWSELSEGLAIAGI